jgi:hypothetical protein
VRRLGRNGLVATCGALVCLAPAAIAVAATPSSPTKLVLDRLTQSGEGPDLEGHFVGHLKSPNEKCLRGRTVKLILRNGNTGDSKLADTDKTGRSGHWRLDANLFMIDRARVKVKRKVVGSGNHRRVCDPDSLSRRFA